MELDILNDAYAAHFNAKANIYVRAPGRVNLIGEHTDYNEGFAMPMAIDRYVSMALAPRKDSRVRIFSLDYGKEISFDLQNLARGSGWAEYIKGVADQMQKAGYPLRGFEAVMTGDIPRGAGLSSSAAVELAAARAFASSSELAWNPVAMARLSQRAENEWVGVQCGILDQMASAASQAGNAMLLDCRTLDYAFAPLPDSAAVVILDTGTRRGLVESAYNERRRQCEEAARALGVKALRDVEDIARLENLPVEEAVQKRARHIITENARVLQAERAMKAGDMTRLGALFHASHESLRDDFEVSSDALNWMADSAQEDPDCYGARMTGAGFGGCAVALVKSESAGNFSRRVAERYQERSGIQPSVYVCRASAGAEVFSA